MGCCKAPIIIDTGGGEESPGGGLVDSVTGEGVIDVTPTQGDPVVSVAPGADGEVLVTDGTTVEWAKPFDAGSHAPTFSNENGVSVAIGYDYSWIRVYDRVFAHGFIRATVATANAFSSISVDLPVPSTGSNNLVTGVITAVQNVVDAPVTVGSVNYTPTDPQVVNFWLRAANTNQHSIHYSFSYQAAV
ncbi:hypothetical protein [Phytoactinopolyspora mesophila]|uniref:Uncharacterized protein n=1 Tax=Phytoactinopolyspora mesophila TaxID=2650750 RepID=A0A7K3M6G8_9ACTN|nr:hypothetical protein [Phytoactinopolyspora mesophila]NDL58637.1 hypothetical protein [Phytoactinopolyspora mesophila]